MQSKTKQFRTKKVQIGQKTKMKSWSSSFRLTNKNKGKAQNKFTKKAKKASKQTTKVRH